MNGNQIAGGVLLASSANRAHGLLPCGHALMLLDERTEYLGVVQSEIHLIAEPSTYGVCRGCGPRFAPDTSQSAGWRAQVTQQYDAQRKQGTCKREDASQAAARIGEKLRSKSKFHLR
jgi:hypothetical protein